MFGLHAPIDAKARSKNGAPHHKTTGVANKSCSQLLDRMFKSRNGCPGSMSAMAKRNTGKLKVTPSQKRRRMSANSGLARVCRVGFIGSRAMPHIGQAAGVVLLDLRVHRARVDCYRGRRPRRRRKSSLRGIARGWLGISASRSGNKSSRSSRRASAWRSPWRDRPSCRKRGRWPYAPRAVIPTTCGRPSQSLRVKSVLIRVPSVAHVPVLQPLPDPSKAHARIIVKVARVHWPIGKLGRVCQHRECARMFLGRQGWRGNGQSKPIRHSGRLNFEQLEQRASPPRSSMSTPFRIPLPSMPPQAKTPPAM